MEIIRKWYKRYLSDPQVIILALLLVVGFAVVISLGHMLAPVLAGVVLAYLLDGVVERLQRLRLPRTAAVSIVFSAFMMLVILVLFGLMPHLFHQVTQLFQQVPLMIGKGQATLLQLPEQYPGFISEHQVREMMGFLKGEVTKTGQRILSLSFASVIDIIALAVYVILVPVLVFFFLKDKYRIFAWLKDQLPSDLALSTRVWHEVNVQIANYVRGKAWEVLIVSVVSYATFTIMGLQYAMLLATVVGLSVIIPYIGAAAATVPIALIAYFQWGWSTDFAYLMLAYGIIQLLDGNVLVPLLFSEAVDLHPVAIIVAVLVFGGLWGFWGIFFAIPLATLVQAVIKALPREPDAPSVAVE
jgi:putative permease